MDTHTDAHAHAHSHIRADDMPFSEEEIHLLHKQDRLAATYVVGLLLAIFCMGIVLYSIVVVTL